MFTVMGASGHTGRRITETLLQAGERVRALGRSATKLPDLEHAGADVMIGDATDASFLAEAFRGADAVYTLIAPDAQSPDYRAAQDAHGNAITAALRQSGVPNVVFLSSLGGELPSGTGPIAGLHDQEQRLRRLQGVNVLVLRPTYFFENFYETLGLIKHQGINGGAIAADLPMAMIASRDIADVAARALRNRSWKGLVVRELLGERDLTQVEATRILGAEIGKPDLRYIAFPYDDYQAALVQAGLSPSVATLYTEMARAMNDGTIKSLEGRTPQNTTPTRFEDFARDLAHAYAAV